MSDKDHTSSSNSGSGDASSGQNVIDFFSGRKLCDLQDQRIIRLAPELDGLEMLYSNEASKDKFFSLRILCWALRESGEVVGLVPWLKDITACPDIADPLNGQWEGYYDARLDEIFYEPPIHKVVEIETAAEYYSYLQSPHYAKVQEISDTIGTHVVFSDADNRSITLQEVISWQLDQTGLLKPMIVDEDKVSSTPILPGDDCLVDAKQHPQFRYFFQHHIANKIKSEDPEALAAISMLVDEPS